MLLRTATNCSESVEQALASWTLFVGEHVEIDRSMREIIRLSLSVVFMSRAG